MHKSLYVCIVQDDKISESTSFGSSKIAGGKHYDGGKESRERKKGEGRRGVRQVSREVRNRRKNTGRGREGSR